jgi:energy-coupling factor transporter ATP-binding protein EcfA2
MTTGVVEGVAAANTAIKVFEKAHKQGWLDKLVNVFRKKHRVLVLGTTGTGKTNLLQSMQEIAPKAIDQMNRTEFAQKHSISILRQPFIFVDTPGQRGHASVRKQAILEAMSHKISGVINVVSYGYHEYRTGKSRAIADNGSPRDSFLEEHRKIELETLNEWTTLLGDKQIVGWLITVVTKADLWWDKKDEVLDYYTSGPYYSALGDAQKLSPVVREYCSVLHKFYSEGSLSGAFDEEDRVKTKANLLSQLMAAIGKNYPNG